MGASRLSMQKKDQEPPPPNLLGKVTVWAAGRSNSLQDGEATFKCSKKQPQNDRGSVWRSSRGSGCRHSDPQVHFNQYT